MFSMILISHLNFTTKRERIPYILAFFESCLLEYLKSQVDVDKSTETQVYFIVQAPHLQPVFPAVMLWSALLLSPL